MVEEKQVRIGFNIPESLYKKTEEIPWGMRSMVLRMLLERLIDAGEKHGLAIYGAIMSGDFELTYKERDHDPA
jgi:hypothetical protein